MQSRALLIAALALGACAPGQAVERTFSVGQFDRISAAGSSNVTVNTGKAVSVRASGDEAVLDKLDIRVEDGTLIIGTKKRLGMSWGQGKSAVFVTVPMVRSVDVAGSGAATVDRIDVPEFSSSVAGSGNLRLAKVTATRSRFSVAGSGTVEAAGTSADVRASVAGSGDLLISGLKSTNLSASVSGSGNVDAFATSSANVSVAGSGDVRVRGGAKCTVSKSGSGSVDCS